MIKWIAAAIVALLLLAGAWVLPGLRELADVGAGYVAKQMCSCIFVAGRSFDSCRPDMLPDMDRIAAEVLDDGVRASIPLLADRTAEYRGAQGCTLLR